MATWIFQDQKQVEKHGEAKVPWCAGWRAPDGRRKRKACGCGKAGKRLAAEYAAKIDAQLVLGTYQDNSKPSPQTGKLRVGVLPLEG